MTGVQTCALPISIPEIISDRENGFLVPTKNPQALSSVILEALSDHNRLERIVHLARQKVEEKYSFSICLGAINDLYNKTKKFKRILIIKISSLGDIILAVPSLKAIRQRFPYAKVTLLTLGRYTSLFYDCPYVDNVVGLEKKYKSISCMLRISFSLRHSSFDYIIDLQNNHASHFISFLSFPRKSFGFSRKMGFLLTNRAKFPYDKSVSPLDSQERILNLLGIKFKTKELVSWDMHSHDISSFGLAKSNFIGINIAASKNWQTKNWPVDHIKLLISMIYRNFPDLKVVFIGDSDSRYLSRMIESKLKFKVINLCGRTTIRDLIEVLKKMKIFITPDTATLHLSESLGIPTIALFGPTNPSAHTVKSNNLYVLYNKFACSFCYRRKCSNIKCMEAILPARIFSLIKQILSH